MMFVATMLVYNEEEFIENNLLQHGRHFDRLLVIDGCDHRNDQKYVSKSGLSDDNTKKIVTRMAEKNKRIEWYEMPFATKEDNANFYVSKLKDGDIFMRLDGDEFYTWDDLDYIKERCGTNPGMDGITFPILNFWKRLDEIATGGMFDVRHGKCFRYRDGAGFKIDHVRLTDKNGRLYLSDPALKIETDAVVCYHLGFMRADAERYKTNLQYYISRNEKASRPNYISCREAFLTGKLPPDCRIKSYEGCYPEIFYSMFKKQLFAVNN